ncbi:MAG: hypothetical protein AB1679_33725 [Actinomycetota bacterium]
MKITPTHGTRRFRRACSLTVEDDALVVTDRKGTVRRFPLNQGPTSPAVSVMISATPFEAFRSQRTIVDGSGEILVLCYVGDWDAVEWLEFERAAGLPKDVELSGEPKTRLRQDGLVLEDGTWWRWAPQAGTLAFVAAMITGAGVVPAVLGSIVVLGLVVYIVVALTSGAYGKGRRGKGADAEEAFAAGDDHAWDKLIEEATKPLPEKKTDPPEAAT